MTENTLSLEASPVDIVTYYRFQPISEGELPSRSEELSRLAELHQVRGLTILAIEGVNATLSGNKEGLEAYLASMEQTLGLTTSPVYKWSQAHRHPFHEFKVKIRPEIVTLQTPELVPSTHRHRHLSPEEWNKAMNEKDVVVIDTRNQYETVIGTFKGAMDPKIDEFSEFPKFLENGNLDRNQKTLIFCTGGIRCEKAILEMERLGFNNVYQLEGGILNYLKTHPNQGYEGECFVFDYRVAVDQNLEPSRRYRLCPHCGGPAEETLSCIQCGVEERVCTTCQQKGPEFHTCSKNCAHHYRMGHKSKKIHWDGLRKRAHHQPAIEVDASPTKA